MRPGWSRAATTSSPPGEVVADDKPSTSFEDLYRAYFSFVWRNLRALGVPTANLEDAVQEVFVVVHRRGGDFDPGGEERAVRSWLYAILMRVARDHRRRLGRKEGRLDPMDRNSGPQNSVDTGGRLEAADVVDRVLARLPEDLRVALVLTEIEQMTAKEIAELLGANVNTVSSRVRAARERFEEIADRLMADPGTTR